MSAARQDPTGTAPGPAGKNGPPKGEPMVWLASLGLAAGLLMVAGLLWVIADNGLRVFWPDRAIRAELVEGVEFRGTRVLEGELVETRVRVDAAGDHAEWKLYLGNKDVYGLAFHFLDEKSIARSSRPPDLAKIERLEYGDAIGEPVALSGAGGEIAFGREGFDAALREAIAEAAARRREIGRIEKVAIGAVNARMEVLRLESKRLGRQGDREGVTRAEARLAEMEVEYQGLADKATGLRARLGERTLRYRLATGEVKEIPVGQVLGYYYPNRLGTAGRAALAAHRFWRFLSEEPREANTEGGVFPAIFGTFFMTLLMSCAVVPFGVVAAIYLREYARQGAFVQAVRIAVNNLAGVPSIVFGVFGLGFFVYAVGGTIDSLLYADRLPTPTFGTGGVLWASLTLALMTVPVVIVATEEALAAVPRGMREGSLACGASKWQTIQRIVLPGAVPGILTGLILAMARGAGEVAPLMLVGVVKLAPTLPVDAIAPFVHMERKFMHLGFHIYDLGFQSPDSEAAKPMVFATTFLLILLVVVLNLAAILLRERIRRKYATGAF